MDPGGWTVHGHWPGGGPGRDLFRGRALTGMGPDDAAAERMARPSRRKVRRRDFDDFVEHARATFARIAAQDPRNAFFDAMYSLRVTPGGARGGLDRRLVEVFYGNRPIEAVTEFVTREGREPRLQERLLAEHGACLFYQHMDSGIVLAGLRPAGSEGFRRREEMIPLEWIRGTHALTGPGTLERHWRAFVSYMEYTSLEGEPTLGDRLRVWWMLFVRPTVVKGEHATALCWRAGAVAARFALTVGLSGFLLAIVQALTASSPPH